MPAPFDPECIFASLDSAGVRFVLVGGLAGVLHGSPTMTNDADIVPDRDDLNLACLGEALRGLDARLRDPGTPDGVPFDPHPALLRSMNTLTCTTRCGDLDLTFFPDGFADSVGGYEALERSAVTFEIGGVGVRVASLADIIRSKEAADRPKDRATLPILRALQQEIARLEEK